MVGVHVTIRLDHPPWSIERGCGHSPFVIFGSVLAPGSCTHFLGHSAQHQRNSPGQHDIFAFQDHFRGFLRPCHFPRRNRGASFFSSDSHRNGAALIDCPKSGGLQQSPCRRQGRNPSGTWFGAGWRGISFCTNRA